MGKRNRREGSSREAEHVMANSDSLNGLEQQVIAIAEQLGRIAGAAQARADQWLDSPRFRAQLTHVRDRASLLLGRLSGHPNGNGTDGATQLRAQSREKVAAPGKKHRKAPDRSRGVKHSDEKIMKAQAARRRRPARPRQG